MLTLVVCLFAAAPHVWVSRQAVRVDAQVLEAVEVEPGLLLVPPLAEALKKAALEVGEGTGSQAQLSALSSPSPQRSR